MTDQNSQKKKVLAGYKKVGAKFIPPAMQMGAPLKEVSYARQILPELIWWDVLLHQQSHRFSVAVATAIGEFFRGKDGEYGWLVFISEYAFLTPELFADLNSYLEKKGLLSTLRAALEPFLNLYPECPLAGFLSSKPLGAIDIKYLHEFERRMEILEDKRSKPGILMQAQSAYLGFVLEKLKVFEGSALIDLPELEKYPDTDHSKKVGSMVCAHVNSCSGQFLPPYEEDLWAQYFWKRNLTLRPIKFAHLENENA